MIGKSNGRSLQFARRCAKHSEEKNGPWALTRRSKPSKESSAASSVTRLSANMACHQHSKQNHNPLLPALLDMFLMFLDICMVFRVVNVWPLYRGFKTGQKYYYKYVCATAPICNPRK